MNSTLPTVGDIVRFPESFSAFNLERCSAKTAASCDQGGVVSIRRPKGKTFAEIKVTKLVLPTEGDIVLSDDTDIYFVEVSADRTRELSWLEREHQFDFSCAANWVVTGTSSNPNFAIPCYLDTATFLDV